MRNGGIIMEEKIEFMEKNKEYGIAYCFIDDVYANNLDKIVHVRNIIPDNKGFKNWKLCTN